ncbi:RraA family protein [Specibacter cremeus]|uniref:RraA family protein n=1 Tax=Specibacter cremeus TaxID=1629051 RepID=UPI000F77BBC4|nr:RraA family protein [Specibacter cremeus]
MPSANIRVRGDWTRPDPSLLDAFRTRSVANLGDAMDRLGIVDGGIEPIWEGARAVGSALPVLTVAGDNLAVIEALEHIRPGDILMINAFGYNGRAIMGDNLAQRFEHFGATGAVLDGYARDRSIIRDLGFPVFARGLTPAGPFKHGPGTIGEPVAIGGVVVNAGDIVVADDDGVIVIPVERAPEVLAEVVKIEELEASKDAEVAAMRGRST